MTDSNVIPALPRVVQERVTTGSNATNVDLPAVRQVVNQLGALSTSMGHLTNLLQDGGGLTWTGGDKTGTALHEQLAPADQGGVDAITATKQAVDGVIDSLGTTAGLWHHTEGTNVELNQ